ncbi:MAG: hypothetical protein MUC92_12660 [Fimbriimonadaceae bacterium]|jgi:flagellar basal-body rod modification protein FlgD|nr:hypothetical protein [Fimbriimonadaceae bacterium]
MSTFPVNTINGHAYFGNAEVKKKSELDMEAFLRLLTVQLANQNPLEPMNDRDFFAQMAQLGQVSGMDDLKSSFEVSQAASLMGKSVVAVRPSGGEIMGDPLVEGVVERLTIRDGKRLLGIKEANGGMVEIEMNAIKEVRS